MKRNRILFAIRNVALRLIGIVICLPCMFLGLFIMIANKQVGLFIGEFPWLMMIEPEEI